MEAEDNVFEIERILDSSVGKGIRYYRVRWKGFGAEEDTWEPEENLFDCKNVLDQYWKKFKAEKAKKARAQKRKSETASKFESGKAKKKKGGRTTNNSTIARIDSSSSLDGQIILPGEEKRSTDGKNSKKKQKRGSDKEMQPKRKNSDLRQSSGKGKQNTAKKKKRKKDMDKNSSDENKAEQYREAQQLLDENENKTDMVQVHDTTVEDKTVDESTSSKQDSSLQCENSSESVGNKSFGRRSWSSYEASPEYVPEYCDETLAYDICDEEEDYEFFADTGYFVKDSVGYEQVSYFARRESLDFDKGTYNDQDNRKGDEDHVDDDQDHVDDDQDHVDDDEDHVDDDEDHVDDDEDHDDDDEDRVDDDDNEDHDDDNDYQVDDDDDHVSDNEDHANGDNDHANDDKDHANGDKDHANDDKDHPNDDKDHANCDKDHANDDEETANGDKDHANGDQDHGDDDRVYANDDEEIANDNKNHVNVDKDHVNVNKDHMDDAKHQVNDDEVGVKGSENNVEDLEGDVTDDESQLKKPDCLVDNKSKTGPTSSLCETTRDTLIETSKEDSKVHSSSLDVTTSMSEGEHQLSSTTSTNTDIEENKEPKEGASLKTSDGLQAKKESLDEVADYNTKPEVSAKTSDDALKSQGNDDVIRDESVSDVVDETVSGDKVKTQRNNELTLKVRLSSSGESVGLTDECLSPEFGKLPTPVKGYFDGVFAERTDKKDTTEPLTQEEGDKEIQVIKDDDECGPENNRGKQEKCEEDSCLELKNQVHEEETNHCKTISNVVANPDVTPAEKLVEIISIDDKIDETINDNRLHESIKGQTPILVAKEANTFDSESDKSNTVEIEGTRDESNKYGSKDTLSDTSLSKSENVSNVVEVKEQTSLKTANNPIEKERKLSEEETAHCLLDLSSVRLGKSSKMEMIETNLQPSKDNLVENSIVADVVLKKIDKLESRKELSDIKPPQDTTKIENVEQNKVQFSLKRKSCEKNNEMSGKKCRLPLNLPFIEEDCKEVLDILDHAVKPAQERETERSVTQPIVRRSRETQTVSHVEETVTSNSSSVTHMSTSAVTLGQKSTTTPSQGHSELMHQTTYAPIANIERHGTLIMPKIRLSSLNISEKKPESAVLEKTKGNTENKHMPDIVTVSNVPKSNLVSSQHGLTLPVLSSVSNENVLQCQFIKTVEQPSTSIPLRHSSPSGGNVGGVKITQVYGKGKYEGSKQGVGPVSWSGETTKTYPYSTQFSPSGSLHLNSNLYSDTPSANAFIVGHLNQGFSVSPSSITNQFSQQQFLTQPNTHTNQKPFSAVAGINWYPDNKSQRGPRQLFFVPSTNLLPKPLYYVQEFPTPPQHSKQPLYTNVYARALQEMAKRRQINSSGQSVSSDFINKGYRPPFDGDRTVYAKRVGSTTTVNSSQTIQTEIEDGKANVYPSIGNQADIEVRRLSNNIKVTISNSTNKDDLISVSEAEKSETKLSSRINETKEGELMVSSPSVSLASKEDTQQFKISDKTELVCDLDKSEGSKTISNLSESQADKKLEILERIDSGSCSSMTQSKVKDKNINKDKCKGISDDVGTSNSESNKKSQSSLAPDSKSSGNRSRRGSKERGRDSGSSQECKEKRSDPEKSRGKDREISRKKEDSSKTSRSKESDRQSRRDSRGKELKRQESVDLEFEFDFDEYSPGEVITEKSEKMDVSQSGIPAAMSLRQVKSAIKQGDSATVLASLAGGMNIDSKDSVTGMTLLMRAVTFGQENIVKLLLNHGANINIKDNTGSTPLIAACEQGFENIVSLLLNVEIDINAKQTASGETALIKACMNGHHSVVSMLLAHGADCQMRSVSGLTAAQLAVQCGQFEIRDLLESHSKKLQRCVETTIASCLCDSSKLMYPPLLPFVSLYPAEGQEFTYHFHCSNLLLSKTILLFCLRAIFSRSGQVDLSFSKDNGLHTVLLNGSLQSPVLSNNKSVFVLQPKLDTNRLILQTYQSHVHLLVCIYAAELDENSINMVSSPMAT